MAGELPNTAPHKAPKRPAATERRAYTRLTRADHIVILKLHDDGISLSTIAQRLNRSVSTIHEVVQTYTPTTDLAKRKLAAGAERMAENVLEHGKASDHVRVLEGLDVLKSQDFTLLASVLIGMPGQPVPMPTLPDIEVLSPAVTRELVE